MNPRPHLRPRRREPRRQLLLGAPHRPAIGAVVAVLVPFVLAGTAVDAASPRPRRAPSALRSDARPILSRPTRHAIRITRRLTRHDWKTRCLLLTVPTRSITLWSCCSRTAPSTTSGLPERPGRLKHVRGGDRPGLEQSDPGVGRARADRRGVPYRATTTNTQVFGTIDDHNQFKIGGGRDGAVNGPASGATPTMNGSAADYISTFTSEIGARGARTIARRPLRSRSLSDEGSLKT